MENFVATSTIGLKKSGMPSCGIFCLHYITGQSIADIFLQVKSIFNRKGRYSGTTTIYHRSTILKKYGIKFSELKTHRQTLKSFMDDAGHISHRFILMVRTGRHVQIVHNGKVIDQSGSFDIADFWGKNKIVTHVLKIEGSK